MVDPDQCIANQKNLRTPPDSSLGTEKREELGSGRGIKP